MRDISIIISPLGAPEINYNIVEIKFFFIVIVSFLLPLGTIVITIKKYIKHLNGQVEIHLKRVFCNKMYRGYKVIIMDTLYKLFFSGFMEDTVFVYQMTKSNSR